MGGAGAAGAVSSLGGDHIVQPADLFTVRRAGSLLASGQNAFHTVQCCLFAALKRWSAVKRFEPQYGGFNMGVAEVHPEKLWLVVFEGVDDACDLL